MGHLTPYPTLVKLMIIISYIITVIVSFLLSLIVCKYWIWHGSWFMVLIRKENRKSWQCLFVWSVQAIAWQGGLFFTLAEEKCQQSVTLLQLNIFLPNALFIRKFPTNPTISFNGKLNFIFKFCDNNTIVSVTVLDVGLHRFNSSLMSYIFICRVCSH